MAIARTRAAKPAAELARPAAVGKLLTLTMRRGHWLSLGRGVEDCDSSVWRRERREWRQAWVRAWVEMFWGWPFKRRVSPWEGG